MWEGDMATLVAWPGLFRFWSKLILQSEAASFDMKDGMALDCIMFSYVLLDLLPFVMKGLRKFCDFSALFHLATDFWELEDCWITVQNECLSFLVLFMASWNYFWFCSLYEALLEFLFDIRP